MRGPCGRSNQYFATAACKAEGSHQAEAAQAQWPATEAAEGCSNGALAAEGVQPKHTHGVEPLQACRSSSLRARHELQGAHTSTVATETQPSCSDRDCQARYWLMKSLQFPPGQGSNAKIRLWAFRRTTIAIMTELCMHQSLHAGLLY